LGGHAEHHLSRRFISARESRKSSKPSRWKIIAAKTTIASSISRFGSRHLGSATLSIFLV
jgi:hypothetical protein